MHWSTVCVSTMWFIVAGVNGVRACCVSPNVMTQRCTCPAEDSESATRGSQRLHFPWRFSMHDFRPGAHSHSHCKTMRFLFLLVSHKKKTRYRWLCLIAWEREPKKKVFVSCVLLQSYWNTYKALVNIETVIRYTFIQSAFQVKIISSLQFVLCFYS